MSTLLMLLLLLLLLPLTLAADTIPKLPPAKLLSLEHNWHTGTRLHLHPQLPAESRR